ncbi:MAG: putative dehydrogenase [Planctomycetaceae bacterium]|nr:putative dehydrogenase [Planctomycetaceae bacterium]
MSLRYNRRQFLENSAKAAVAGAILPSFLGDLCYGYQAETKSKNDRLRLGSIGVGGQGTGIMMQARHFADQIAVADVDQNHVQRGIKDTKAEAYGDYRKLLDRQDIDIVTIGTPDHWHTKICIEAMQAGKDVYCEKPLTLTIQEGQQLVKVVKETGKILQVGTQQRSQGNLVFLRAVATVRSGQLGKIQKVTVSLPLSTEVGGPFAKHEVPKNLDWDMWLGQAPKVDYCPERCHFRFRWWYEYSGGIVTDWGAHHMDVAQWGLNMDQSGPLTIDGTKTTVPRIMNGFNTPKEPIIDYTYAGDIQLQIVTGDEFVMFEGDKGRVKVNRGRVTGKAIEEQDADKGLMDKTSALMAELYHSGKPGNHMGNFVECVKSRKQPISDVVSQHRSVSACHLGNIAARLQRKLVWDPAMELFTGDDEANKMVSRAQREGYEINV